MEDLVNNIITENTHLLTKLDSEIAFDLDHEGKRIINQQTQQLYKSRLKNAQIIEIILRSVVAIRKMIQMKNCGWSAAELKERLTSSLEYYSVKFDTDLYALLSNQIINRGDFVDDINDKYPAKFRALDGHYVRSKSELLIDNLLFSNNIVHAYEKKLPGHHFWHCDFYLPALNGRNQPVYIEYWGYPNDERYQKRKSEKLEIYRSLKLNLVEIFDEDTHNLHEVLSKKLRQFNVSLE